MNSDRRHLWPPVFLAAAVAVGSLLAAGSVAAAPSSRAVLAAAPTGAAAGSSTPDAVVVVLRDQLPDKPATRSHVAARRAAATATQDQVLSRLPGTAPKKLKHYTLGNAFSATVTTAQAAALAADPAVLSVSPDVLVPVTPAPAVAAAAAPPATAAAVVPAAACSTDPNRPRLEPEALSTINARSDNASAATAAALGIDGSGVKVAFIADGINPLNAGFRRKDGTSAIVDYQDFYGDGPNAVTSGAEAFGDASAIAAQGNTVYDIAGFANPRVVSFPGGHCYIRVVGVAPGASVVALKAGSDLLPNSAIVQAIDYAVTVDHVDVLNESFGGNLIADSSSTRNTIQVFNDQAVAAGTTVSTSSGDAGPTSTIGSPATDPLVISAGASTDSRAYEQTGYALAPQFSNGTWRDNEISSLSSAGITQTGRTIDLSAPGETDWAVCDAGGNFTGCTSFQRTLSPIQLFGGTSQSSPFTAGVAALVIQAYRKAHSGISPAPALVKQLITSTTRDLGFPGQDQGTGLLDAKAAVEAALTYPGSTAPAASGVSSNIALSTDQLTITGAPGTTKTASVRVRNVGSKPLTVIPSTRRYVQLADSRQAVAISAASTQTTPYPTNAAPWVYRKATFPVPSGADVLNTAILWRSGAPIGGTGPAVRLTLIDPTGAYVGNTRPQGGPNPANYGDVLVRRPVAGTWTAILYTPASTGFTGTVTLDAQAQRAVPVGAVSPSLFTVPPGAARTVTLTLPMPTLGGDTSYTLSLGSSGGHQTALPVIMRALVPTGSGTGVFAGTITGGNARATTFTQTFSYAFDVPAGKKDLDVAVHLAHTGDLLQGVLIDPNGETPSEQGNVTPTGALSANLVNVVAAPIPGRWRYVIALANPVSGNELTEPFVGVVTFNKVKVSGSLPARGALKAGKAHQVRLVVTNTGPLPLAVQTDARTATATQVQLAPQFAGSTFSLPLNVEKLSEVPAYLVPPDTSNVSLSASSSVPAQVELSSPAGGIDLLGDLQAAKNGSTVSTATVAERSPAKVGQGYWSTYVQEIGPFGDGGAPAAETTVTAVATTAQFDPAVTSSTGDPFLPAVDPTADPGTAVVVNPGKSVTIIVTITPTAAAGSTVRGVLHLVTTPTVIAGLFYSTGDILANLPYSYTVN